MRPAGEIKNRNPHRSVWDLNLPRIGIDTANKWVELRAKWLTCRSQSVFHPWTVTGLTKAELRFKALNVNRITVCTLQSQIKSTHQCQTPREPIQHLDQTSANAIWLLQRTSIRCMEVLNLSWANLKISKARLNKSWRLKTIMSKQRKTFHVTSSFNPKMAQPTCRHIAHSSPNFRIYNQPLRSSSLYTRLHFSKWMIHPSLRAIRHRT